MRMAARQPEPLPKFLPFKSENLLFPLGTLLADVQTVDTCQKSDRNVVRF